MKQLGIKEFCDEIVEVLPLQSKKEKILEIVSQAFFSTSVMIGIWFVGRIIEVILKRTSVSELFLTLANVTNGLMIVIIATVIVNYICKTSFASVKEPSRIKLFFVAWVIFFGFSGQFI